MESRSWHALCPPPSTAPRFHAGSCPLALAAGSGLPAGCRLPRLHRELRAGPGHASAEWGRTLYCCVFSFWTLLYQAACAVTEGMKVGRQISCSPNSEASPAGFLPSFLGSWEDKTRAALLTSCSTGIWALVPVRWEGILAPGSSARAQPGPAAPWL